MRCLPFLITLLFANSILAAQPQVCAPPAQTSSNLNTNTSCLSPLPKFGSSLAAILGWISAPVTAQNLCGGYYTEPTDISAHPNPLPLTAMQMDITSRGPAVYRFHENSTLEENVKLLQPGREIRADKVVLIPNQQTGKIEEMELEGNVRFQESGRVMVGNMSHVNFAKGTLMVKQGAYHVVRPAETGPIDSWGIAEEAHRDSPTFFWFEQATYTTCRPTDPSWYLKSKHITLNKQTGRGSAKQVVLYAKDVPFFYLPYLSFPIDKSRYSGFLYPNFGYDSHSGAFIGIPYYFNLASNYDDTLTLTPMSKRGLMFNNLFRYLTQRHSGSLQLGFLPDDREFAAFKRNTPNKYEVNAYNKPFLNALADSSTNRGSIFYHDEATYNAHWRSTIDVNYVTDDYYFQDLSSSFSAINTDQLLNQAAVNYEAEHWKFSGRVQAWQTLHPINQTFALDQYQRLPELSLSGAWPDTTRGLNYTFNSEWVLFDHAADFFTGLPYPTGSRFHLNPQVSLPFVRSAGFMTPALELDLTSYAVNNNGVINANVSPVTIVPSSNPDLNRIRALPIFSIDSGLYLDRDFSLGKQGYHQTLEPRLFYLLVPRENQNEIPIFDTALPPFSFDELYRTNRFIGYDRVGDANQLAMGITSRILDGYTGAEKVKVGVGAIYYFRNHQVCLYPDCHDVPNRDDKISPIAAQATYHLNPAVSVMGNAAWDPNTRQMDNDSISLRYSPGLKRILNLSYDYIRNGDVLNAANINSRRNNLHRVNLSVSWPLTLNWNVVGNWNYNISRAHPQTYFYGLEYETCCWAARVVSSRVLQSEDIHGHTAFRSAYYLQFSLKGLGSVGDSAGSELLTTSIPGYLDIFR